MRLEYYSDRGGYNGTSRVKGYREHNEDTIGCFRLDLKESSDLPIYVLVVCDGMGGGVRGKYASSLTVQAIKSVVGSIKLSDEVEDLLYLVQKKSQRVSVKLTCACVLSMRINLHVQLLARLPLFKVLSIAPFKLETHAFMN